MKVHLSILLVTLFLFLVMSARAQNETGAEAAETPAVDTELSAEEKLKAEELRKQQDEAKRQAEAKKSNTKPPKKVFKPTEEISEDSPVPFPVDI